MSHVEVLDAKWLAALAEIDAAAAEKVRASGCVHCGAALDRADYPRKARGELGEAASAYEKRLSFCCRRQGCRKRATPPSLRFLGRKVYIAAVVVAVSAIGQTLRLSGPGRPGRVHGVPVVTLRRWLAWWQSVLGLSAFFAEAKGFLSEPVEVAQLPASLLSRFGQGAAALGKMLRFIAPVTTGSVQARISMAM